MVDSYTNLPSKSQYMKTTLFLISIISTIPLGKVNAFELMPIPSDLAGSRAVDLYYEVHGRVEITEEAAAGMVFDETHLDQDEIVHIQGFDVVREDGSIEESALDGMGANRGFIVLYPTPGTHNVSISLEGIDHFQNFYAEGYHVAGGAIGLYNGGDINFNGLQNVVTFTNNIVEATSGHASGGAIFVTGGGDISSLRADFIGNEARVNPEDSGQAYARGGAIFVGKFDAPIDGYPVSDDTCYVGNLYGNFTSNKAAFGGAIYLGEFGDIGAIHGNFIGNIAEGSEQPGGTTGGAQGGAIRAWKGTTDAIYGNFIDNVAYSKDGAAGGGAISFDGTQVEGGFHGSFEDNIAFSANAEAHGGAFALKNQTGDAEIIFTDASFKNNIAGTGALTPGQALGGAFFIEDSNDVTFRAVNEDVEFTGNHLIYGANWDSENSKWITDDNTVKQYNAIYAIDSVITLETQNDSTITINDSIGCQGESNLVVDAHGSERYDVMINDNVATPLFTIENGGVMLGEYTHEDGTRTFGGFTPNTLTGEESHIVIKENGILNSKADYLDQVDTIMLDGKLELTANTGGSSGRLVASVNEAGKNTGEIIILADTTIAANNHVYAHELSVDHLLQIEADTTVDINHLTFHAADMAEINGSAESAGHHIVMNSSSTLEFDVIDLNVDSLALGDYYDLIVSDGMGDITLDWDFEINVFTYSVYGTLVELDSKYYDILMLPDGGLRVTIIEDTIPLPEPSTATLSLIALAGLMARRRRKSN